MGGKAFPLLRACSLEGTPFERGDPATPPSPLQAPSALRCDGAHSVVPEWANNPAARDQLPLFVHGAESPQ